jgi:hypothetical protein
MRKTIILFFIVFGVFLMNTKSFAFSGSGAGTAVSPYQITSCTQLQEMSSGLTSYYILKNDIDCSATTGWNSGAGFLPIGTYFIGNFDGKGYKITNLFINRPATSNVGLFANVGSFNPTPGIIKNVGLESANITGNSSVGGISGYFISGEISTVYVTGSILGNGTYVGGLVGQTDNSTTPALLNSFSRATVTGNDRVGGAIGSPYWVVTNVYSTGVVTRTGGASSGGLVGYNTTAVVTNSFWDTQTSGTTTSYKGTGKTTSEMKATSTFINYNFDKIWAIDTNGIINNGYPYLNVFNGWTTTYTLETLSGTGTTSDPYIISDCNKLQNMKNSLTSYYTLTQNIDCSTYSYNGDWNGFLPIGLTSAAPFIGTFDGMNYKITGLYINRPNTDYAGLFGFAGNSGSSSLIRNIGLENVDITGKAFVGGIIGRLQRGTISNSYTTGKVYSIGSSLGGLVGYMGLDALVTQISNSFSKATSIGNDFSGGAIGQAGANATLLNVYSTGFVFSTGGTGVYGGLVGNASGGTYTNTFWDTQTSGTTTSLKGTGKTTLEMQTQSTFTNWDFDTIWTMIGYPYLKPMSKTLTYLVNTGGTIVGTTTQAVTNGGNGTLVTAVPDSDYRFVQWSDGATSTSRTDTNIISDTSFTAEFIINQRTLSYTAGSNGSITGTTTQTVTIGQNGTEVIAVPNAGYHFVSWNDGVLTASRTDLNITNNISVIATFSINIYTVVYNSSLGGSIIGSSTQAIEHGNNATNVLASSSLGYHFLLWNDDYAFESRTDTNITANATHTANFAIDTHTLTYIADVGGTIVGSSTQIINYGSNGNEVVATPNAGYRFFDWSDNVTNSTRSEINVIDNITITALFRKISSRKIINQNCGSFDYTDWSSCKNEFQTRSVINSYPQGCTNGEPLTYQTCIMQETIPVLDTSVPISVEATLIEPILTTETTTIKTLTNKIFTKNLQITDVDEEVRHLQKFLNSEGFIISKTGAGSLGKETNIFGLLTKKALIKYQEANTKDILTPLGLKKGTGYFGKTTRDFINSK